MEKKVGEIYKIPRAGASYFKPASDESKHLSSYHSFVITEVHDYGYTAHMLTTSKEKTYPENMLMEENHFQEIVEGFGFKFKGTHFFKRPLIKSPELDVKKIGDLTIAGLSFIKNNQGGNPIPWGELFPPK